MSTIKIPSYISIAELAKRLDLSPTQIIASLMKNGVLATINEYIDFDTASIICEELGYQLELEEEIIKKPLVLEEDSQNSGTWAPRPPVVAIMGHVDHGKTSLLDYIRKSKVAAREHGGITQHISSYQADIDNRKITFLDTPGHEAFSKLRTLGSKMTDIIVLVVAGDDGVKPQTIEVIELAKKANVDIIVAVSKSDRESFDMNKIKQDLSNHDVLSDDWGGKIPILPVSSKTGEGVDELLSMILLVTDINKPKAIFDGPASGLIIESHFQKGQGAVATLLIQQGTLNNKDIIVAGATWGKIKRINDYLGQEISSATVSMPVQILGLKDAPEYGQWFEVVENDKVAKAKSSVKTENIRNKKIKSINSAEDLLHKLSALNSKELKIIVKADVQGSLESLLDAIAAIGNEEFFIRVVSSGLGNITEKDIQMAYSSTAVIVAFHSTISANTNQLAKKMGVNFKTYKIIYELLDDVTKWLEQIVPMEEVITETGVLEIQGVFSSTKDQVVCGGLVKSGQIKVNDLVKLMRDGQEITTGSILNIEKNKLNVKDMVEGEIGGLKLKLTAKVSLGDQLLSYKTTLIKPSL
jgi:translation initiation factor IF-2